VQAAQSKGVPFGESERVSRRAESAGGAFLKRECFRSASISQRRQVPNGALQATANSRPRLSARVVSRVGRIRMIGVQRCGLLLPSSPSNLFQSHSFHRNNPFLSCYLTPPNSPVRPSPCYLSK